MKTRQGFVSNSSTSSFCIFGAEFELEEFLKGFEKKKKENDEEDEDGEDMERAYEYAEKIGLEFYSCGEYSDCVYAGLSWSTVEDNETGKEFKDSVKKLIHGKFPKKKCDTYQEAYQS